MQIKNIDGLTVQQLKDAINQGGKFVLFPYTISIVILTFKRSSDVYFIRPGEGSIKYSVGFVLTNLLLGWWGIPWGPIYTIGSLVTHIGGGKDVTREILGHIIQHDPNAATNSYNVPGSSSNSSNSGQQQNQNQTYNIPR